MIFQHLKAPDFEIQYYRDINCMPPNWKVGLINLVSKMLPPHTISLMVNYFFHGGLYKAFTKVLEKKSTKLYAKVDTTSPIWSHCRYDYILHNVLNVQMVMYYAWHTHQYLIMV